MSDKICRFCKHFKINEVDLKNGKDLGFCNKFFETSFFADSCNFHELEEKRLETRLTTSLEDEFYKDIEVNEPIVFVPKGTNYFDFMNKTSKPIEI